MRVRCWRPQCDPRTFDATPEFFDVTPGGVATLRLRTAALSVGANDEKPIFWVELSAGWGRLSPTKWQGNGRKLREAVSRYFAGISAATLRWERSIKLFRSFRSRLTRENE